MIAYPALLDVPTELAEFLAALLAAERVNRGTRTGSRALSCTDQAVFALVWFRESRDIPLIGKGPGDLPGHRLPLPRRGPRACSPPAPPTCTTRCNAATTRAGLISSVSARVRGARGLAGGRTPAPRRRRGVGVGVTAG